MDISWEDARLFLAVAEGGSLSAGARAVRLGQPTVSRRIAALEASVGGALFRRGERGTTLTPLGERLLEPTRRMAEWASELARQSAGDVTGPEGLVRVTAPPGVASQVVVPLAARLRRTHPSLRLEVLSTMEYLDLARGDADLAVRIGPPPDPALVVLARVRQPLRVWVAPALRDAVSARPTLAALPWIAWAPPYDHLPPNPQLRACLADFRPVFTSDSLLVQVRAAEEGIGALATRTSAARIARTSLVPLDLEIPDPDPSEVHVLCGKRALQLPRVRAVADALIEALRDDPAAPGDPTPS